MQSANRVEKFDNSRKNARKEMRGEGRQDRRKLNKTQRGNDRWDQSSNDF